MQPTRRSYSKSFKIQVIQECAQPERRAALLKMLLPPLNLSMAEVSRREGVSEMSLSNWRKQLGAEGSAVS
ncbi:hypothetical protein A243_06088, partial [Pseudomonas syringae pv. actinidiae ICMP 18883]